MLNFNDAIAQLLGGFDQDIRPKATIQVIPVNHRFEEFKQWVISYVQEHDELKPHHQTLQRLGRRQPKRLHHQPPLSLLD